MPVFKLLLKAIMIQIILITVKVNKMGLLLLEQFYNALVMVQTIKIIVEVLLEIIIKLIIFKEEKVLLHHLYMMKTV